MSPSSRATARWLGDRRVMHIECQGPDSGGVLTPLDSYVIATGIAEGLESRIPLVLSIATTGPSVPDGVASLSGWGRIARNLTKASGVVPLFAVATGPVLSGPALLLGLVDFAIFTPDSYSYVSGPQTVEAITGVPITASSLGGVSTHSRSTGLAALVADGPDDALDTIAEILAYVPDSVDDLPDPIETVDPPDRPTPEAGDLIPDHPTGSYDVRQVIASLADDGDFLELRSTWAPNMVTGFASFGGQPVGIVANQSQSLAGSIDIPASQKGARFVGFCDSLNIPLLTLVDTSGFLPGKDLEWRGMIRHGAQLAFSYARATVPRVGLILRKSYGGAYIVMDSVNMGNDIMFAWPSAEVAVMGAKGAVEILHRKASPEERVKLEAQYERDFLSPYPAAERGSITSVIEPSETRAALCAAFRLLSTKREKLRVRHHDNLPL